MNWPKGKCQKGLCLSLVFNIVLCIFLLLVNQGTKNEAAPLRGFYQNTENLPNYYNFSFTETAFQFAYNEQIFESGTYVKIDSGIYFCSGAHQDFLVCLTGSGFYFYDSERNEVVNAKKLSNIPQEVLL